MARILFVGGGSVGHIAPAVAIWEACQTEIPDAHAHFVCSTKQGDQDFLKQNRLSFEPLDAPRLSWSFPKKCIRAVRTAKGIIDAWQPDVILSKGGYVSLPMCLAAKHKHIPIVLHESDAVSGYANRIVAHFADAVCTGFPATNYKRQTTNYTGNPVRKEITKGTKNEGLRITGLKGDRPILLVMGGSQGAQAINDVVMSMLDDLILRCDIIHITGRNKTTNYKLQTTNYFQTEFAEAELPHLYAAADLAVSRAGAGSLAELAACGIPTVVIPLRGVGHDHQYENAKQAAAGGGCIHLEQSEMDQTLLPAIHNLVTDESMRSDMATKITRLNTQDASLQIAKIIAQTLDSTHRDE